MMKWIVLAVLIGMSLVAGPAWAEDNAFNFNDEVKQGTPGAGFTAKAIVSTPTYKVNAIAVKEEIKAHRHPDGDHVSYIVSGQGTLTLADKPIALKPGMIVHIPKGVAHAVKAEGGELIFLDFSQPPFDPNKMEWIK